MNQQAQQEPLDKIATLPNLITLCRFLLIPVFIYLRFFTELKIEALAVFAIAACTDWVDGQVARRTGQVSKLGKLFDPFVDRFLLATGVITVCLEGNLPLWIVIVLIARDLLLLVEGRISIAIVGHVIPVSYVGKFATAFLLFGFSFLLLGTPSLPALGVVECPWLPGFGSGEVLLGNYLVYIGLVLSITVFCIYQYRGIKQLLDFKRSQVVDAS